MRLEVGNSETWGVGRTLVTTKLEEMLPTSYGMHRTLASHTTRKRPGAEGTSPLHTSILAILSYTLALHRELVVSPPSPHYCLTLQPAFHCERWTSRATPKWMPAHHG